MSTPQSRIKITYPKKSPIPSGMEKYLWEHRKTAPLEKIILRVLLYGKFKEIKTIFLLYPEETTVTAEKYSDVKRGVLFWIKRWNDGKDV